MNDVRKNQQWRFLKIQKSGRVDLPETLDLHSRWN